MAMTFTDFKDLLFDVRSKINEKSYQTLVNLVNRYQLKYVSAKLGMEYISDEKGIRQDVLPAYMEGIPNVDISESHKKHIELTPLRVLSVEIYII